MSTEFREGEMQALRVIDIPEERPVLALQLPEQTSFDEWVAIGRRLCLGRQALSWHIGDWWAFGDHRYGERAAAAAEGIFGLEFKTLRNLAVVSRRFETSRRRDTLTFTHHAEVVALPPSQADELLLKAERERASASFLRREVQALKAANDPEIGSVTAEPKPVPPQTTRADTIHYAEMAIEFAETLQQLRPLTRRENDMLAEAEVFVGNARAGTRPVPETFEIYFREFGRVACEEKFEASRLTVNHWLIQCGKSRLIRERAEFVRFQRDLEQQQEQRPAHETHSTETIDEALLPLAREAAQFLRISRYGGWRITEDCGSWIVGTVRRSSDEMIAMAERQGFDSETARKEIDAE